MRVDKVFPISGYPEHTYVPRAAEGEPNFGGDERPKGYLEDELRAVIEAQGRCAIVIGPSKSGKNSLVRNVLPEDRMVYVHCAGIKRAEHLWEEAVTEMDLPLKRSARQDAGTLRAVGGEVSGGFSKLVAFLTGRVWGSKQNSKSASVEQDFGGPGTGKILKTMRKQNQVLVIDEFHYLPKELQVELGRQLKGAGERRVSTLLLLVNYRGLEPLDLVPDLRGRARVIQLDYWSTEELVEIGHVGFPKLGVTIDSTVIRRIAAESLGSPQLMQHLCQELCFELGIKETLIKDPVPSVPKETIGNVCRKIARSAHAESLYQMLRAGPDPEMEEELPRRDRQRAHIHAVILDACAQARPSRQLTLSEIHSGCSDLLAEGTPPAGLKKALRWMSERAHEAAIAGPARTDPSLYWDGSELHFPDPYFLFYLRWRP